MEQPVGNNARLGSTGGSYRRVVLGLDGTRWRRRNKPIVSRLTMLTPRHGEVYFERLILRNTACRNLEALKHYNGTTYATYRESAVARGLVVNDNEHELCMQEAVDGLSTPHQLRSLFCMLISNGADAC